MLIGTFAIFLINISIGTAILTDHGEIARILVVLFMLCYSTSLGPTPWILVSEILPAKGVSFTSVFDWSTAALLSIGYKPLANLVGDHVMFYFFAASNLLVLFNSLYQEVVKVQ